MRVTLEMRLYIFDVASDEGKTTLQVDVADEGVLLRRYAPCRCFAFDGKETPVWQNA